ncbi:hypothetical protein D3C81_1731830 [compost metagenome]
MHATQVTSDPLHLIDIIRLKLAPTQARENSKEISLMREQRLVIKLNRCGDRDVVIHQIESELVLFLNLLRRPALGTIEFDDKALAILVLELIDAVFIAV